MTRGIAKKSFLKSHQHTPWKENLKMNSTFPLLDKFYDQGRISYLEYILTYRLFHSYSEISQEAVLFICHLIKAAQEGHLCVKVEPQGLNPSPKSLWQGEELAPLSFEEEIILEKVLIKGSEDISSHLKAPLCQYQNCFYVHRHWFLESLFMDQLQRHVSSPLQLEIDMHAVEQAILSLQQQRKLLPEQGKAIFNGCCYPLTLITGGPGTGKTYTAGQLIKVFWTQLTPEQQKNCEIAIAAPTGKAVANLQSSLGKMAAEIEGFPSICAKTIHLLLGLKGSTRRSVPLTADIIIIDECSMMDVRLMAYFFESIKPGARVIMLGDPYQLPSVEAGSLFSDMIHSKDHFGISSVHLKTCLRTELRSIIEFAERINQGDAEGVLAALKKNEEIMLYDLPSEGKLEGKFVRELAKFFPSYYENLVDDQEILNHFQTVRVLSPKRDGYYGVDSLNAALVKVILKTNYANGWIAVPIMITHNDYQRHLFNGETGVLMRKLPLQDSSEQDYAIFPSRENEGTRRLSASMLPRYEYAYCLSVHKSQGSEFDRIVLMMPEGAEIFGREVFYTAVTRARKRVDIYGSTHTLTKTLSEKMNRVSGIDVRAVACAK